MASLDLDQLAERLSRLGVSDLRPLTGGASSLTFSGRRGSSAVVVKVAPPGVPPVLHRDVLRQARVMTALRPTAVPVPTVLSEDPGHPPEVPPLFVMSFEQGSSVEPLFDLGGADVDPAVMGERMRDAVRVLADLHRLVPRTLALGDEPVLRPDQELDRWCRLLQTVDRELVHGWDEVAATLRRQVPQPLPPAVVHGDFRLGNLLAVRARVSTVVDWEIWAVGDPRVDLGWFLANADPGTYARPTPFVGLTPTVEELTEQYRVCLGSPITEVGWFQALACFKSAATWSLIVKHNRRRDRPDPEHESMVSVLPHLLARASELVG